MHWMIPSQQAAERDAYCGSVTPGPMLWTTALREGEFEFWFWHSLALWPWANHWTSPSLSFLSSEMGLIIESAVRTKHDNVSKALSTVPGPREELRCYLIVETWAGRSLSHLHQDVKGNSTRCVPITHCHGPEATHGQEDSEVWGPQVWKWCPLQSVHIT